MTCGYWALTLSASYANSYIIALIIDFVFRKEQIILKYVLYVQHLLTNVSEIVDAKDQGSLENTTTTKSTPIVSMKKSLIEAFS